MTPEELPDYLEEMGKRARGASQTLEDSARSVAGRAKAPGIGVAVGQSGEGVVVRVMSTNPRISTRQLAARLKPSIIREAKRNIVRSLRA